MRDRLYKKIKKNGNLDTKQKFRKIKHHIQKLLRHSYWQYIQDIVTPKETEGAFNSIKKFWTYIKHKTTDHQGISLKQDGKLITDPIPMANVMNDRLKFVFSNAEKITESEFKSNCKLFIKSNYQTMPDITVTCEGIAKLLNLNPNKAAGPDDFCNT
jgi:hypothetical protein